MTVGIVLNNTHTSVAIADSRVLVDNIRYGDVANKLITIEKEQYHGAMVGAGAAQVVFGILRYVKRMKDGNVTQFLGKIKEYWFNAIESIKIQAMETYAKKAKNISKSLKQEKTSIDPSEVIYQLGELEQFLMADCLASIYDKKQNRIRKFRIYPEYYTAESNFESIIGSGADAAELELLKLIPGASLGSIDEKEMVFFAMCGYVRATQNVSVGGLPKIAIIKKEGVKKLPKQTAITLTNIVAAYEADILQRAYAEEQVSNVLANKANIEEIAQKLGLTHYSLQNILVPLDSWIVTANLKRYPKK